MASKTNKYVFEFLREISPSLVALNRKSKLKYTFLASPYLSSSMAVDVFNDRLHLGVPEHIFNSMYKLRIFSLSYIKGKSSIFIVFEVETFGNEKTHPFALRFYIRNELIDIIDKYQKIDIVKMNVDGTFSKRKGSSFTILTREVEELEWED